MRRHIITALALATCIYANDVTAQTKSKTQKPVKKSVKTETIVIREDSPREETTIELKEGKIYVNGDAITDIAATSSSGKKIIIEHGEHTPAATAAGSTNSSRPKAMLGVMSRNATGNDGANVERISPNSPAETAGLRPGDKITHIDENRVTGAADLVEVIAHYQPGDEVTVTYERNGNTNTARARLSENTLGNNNNSNNPRNYNHPEWPQFEMPYGVTPPFWMTPTPRLGIAGENMRDESGVKVLDIKQGSLAEKAGLEKGDIIYQLGKYDIYTINDLQRGLRKLQPGKSYTLKYERDGKEQETTVTISSRGNQKDL